MDAFTLRRGRIALLVSMPHVGTHLPDALRARLTPAALQLPDTDWHLPLLYDFLEAIGASVLVATHSRYVIDLNRPPDGASLYPGADTTGLVPLDTFHGAPLYRDGQAPDADEIAQRRTRFWAPYHEALRAERDRLQAQHGTMLLWDAHSIASHVPRFFEGRLPDLNIGTADGRSCAPAVEAAVRAAMQRQDTYSGVVNGRFKGGYITRQYGEPARGCHAVQLELSTITYMDEAPPYRMIEAQARRVRPVIRALMEAAAAAAGVTGRSA